ncbi:hypothetical protein ACWGJW_23025, partial [Streptomyces nigrescens]
MASRNIPGTLRIKNDALSDHLDGQLRRDSPLETRENPPLRTTLVAAPVMSRKSSSGSVEHMKTATRRALIGPVLL